MGQYWKLFGLDRREYISFGKIWELLWDGDGDALVGQLIVPPTEESSGYAFGYFEANEEPGKRSQGEENRAACSPLLMLPGEIILIILRNLDPVSALNFGLAHNILWKICRTHALSALHGPWSGNRIIALGDYNDPGDYPAGVLTGDEEACLEAEDVYDNHGQEENAGIPASQRFRKVEKTNMLYAALKFERDAPCNAALKRMFTAQGVWILRNKTNREYVRSDELALAFGKPAASYTPFISAEDKIPGLGRAAFSRICWSTDTTSTPNGRFCRGPWAGHRLEVCTWDWHELHADGAWENITQTVVDDLVRFNGF